MSVYYQNKKFTNDIGYTIQTNLTEENIDEILTKKLSEIHSNDVSFGGENNNIYSEIKQIWERLNKTVSLIHNCQNCGARLDIEENHPIFHCKYCGSTYIIGSVQPNSTY